MRRTLARARARRRRIGGSRRCAADRCHREHGCQQRDRPGEGAVVGQPAHRVPGHLRMAGSGAGQRAIRAPASRTPPARPSRVGFTCRHQLDQQHHDAGRGLRTNTATWTTAQPGSGYTAWRGSRSEDGPEHQRFDRLPHAGGSAARRANGQAWVDATGHGSAWSGRRHGAAEHGVRRHQPLPVRRRRRGAALVDNAMLISSTASSPPVAGPLHVSATGSSTQRQIRHLPGLNASSRRRRW